MDVNKKKPEIIILVRQIKNEIKQIANHIVLCVNGFYNDYDGDVSAFPKHQLFEDIALMEDFDISIKAINQPARKSLWGRRGIYVFLVNNDVGLNRSEVNKWNGQFNGGKKGRGAQIDDYKKAKSIEKGKCFYIGSVSRNVSLQTRMMQHYASEENATSGLKLNLNDRKEMKNNLIVILFPIKKKFEEEGRIIIPLIEKELHESLEPIAGNSR